MAIAGTHTGGAWGKWVTASDPIIANVKKTKQRSSKRQQREFGKIERFGNKRSSARILCLRNNDCFGYNSGEGSMSADYLTFQRARPVVLPGSLVISFIAIQSKIISMNKFIAAAIGSGLIFLSASLTQATSIGIDLGPSRVLTGANPEAGPISFGGLNGTPVTGSVSVDFLFTNNEFARIYTATQPLFDASITLQTSGSGFLGFLSGSGFLIDAHGNAIPGFGITGSASGNDGSLSIGLFPLLKDKNGTPNDQLKKPFDFYGVHYDFTFPSNPSLEVTGGEFLLAGNGTFTPFGIGPGNIPADITVPDQGSTFLLLMLSLLGVATYRRLWIGAVR